MSAWGEAKAADGRTYYWNKETKETTWQKPADYDPTAAAAATPTPATPAPTGPAGGAADWNEAKAADGRTYYYNKITRETRWEMPQVLQQARQQQPADFVAGGGAGFDYGGRPPRGDDRPARRQSRDHGLPQKPSFDGPRGGGMPWESRQENTGYRGPMPAKADEPEYGSAEAAEEAFFKLLKRSNVTPDTDWHNAMKLVVRDREYRAIKDPRDRKAAFEKYCREVREQEKAKERERKQKMREDFRKMLTTRDEIKHYTRWKTARPTLEHEVVFRNLSDEDERKKLFSDYILDLKKRHVEDEAERRRVALNQLAQMLQALITDPDTKWVDAEEKIMHSERFVTEEIFKSLHKFDVFVAFEKHIRGMQTIANEKLQREKTLRYRRQRKARDAFKELLNEKLREGKIKARTKWSDIHPLVANDPRYKGYVAFAGPGRSFGSDPQELFWDIEDKEERKLLTKRNDAMDVLEDARFEVKVDTPFEAFAEVMRQHSQTSYLKEDDLKMIFERLIEKVNRRLRQSKLDEERRKKDQIEDLRIAMKKVDPAIRVEDSYESVSERLAGRRDFENADDEMRRAAFDKYIRRLKERDHDPTRRRDRDRERDRDRDRDYRNGSRRDDRERERDRDRDRRHRSPEIDAYEADRRRAQEARERSYRRPSFGLTPPPRDRRDDRTYERGDRRGDRLESIYDRERRERELERERSYISRADPRDKGKTLDYGDDDAVGSRPGSVRKRQSSEGSVSSRRDIKVSLTFLPSCPELKILTCPQRPRRDRRTRSPEPAGVLKEEPPALQSGSEEGEIEEV